MDPVTLMLLAVLAFGALAYHGRGHAAWIVAAVLALLAWHMAGVTNQAVFVACVAVLAVAAVVTGVPALRRVLISRPVMKLAGGALPTIGETESIALEAGTVWWDGELFSGKPDWKKLLKFKIKPLSREEQAFLDGPTEELCRLLDDEAIAHARDLPEKVWSFIRKHKFFGMIIPQEHGGLGFSAAMHSAVVAKLASRSVAAAVTVMVPNSLGPGELLLRYGTPAQRKHYLPRLAKGLDIPCFALTEPHAGSDAANGRSIGVVGKGMWQGKKVVGIRLTFDKRYITLAPVATVIGLAFRLHDPEHLLGSTEDLGITCALIPRATKGVWIGHRHDPMGVPFPNGPIRGKDVFIPMDYIIGGPERVGQGWRMLMEALAAGRGISLPSLSVGAAQLSARAVSAYGLIREQFGMPIAKFEGVRERLTRIVAGAYWMDAVRRLTVGAIDAGEHPAVASGIAKAYLTEGMRKSVNDGMDVMAGAAICRGQRNVFARGYASIPIGITVEGSNILTRSLIVFGQGAIRCHPYLQAEVEALGRRDLAAFDRAFAGHVNHVLRNAARAFVLAITGAAFVRVPVKGKKLSRHARHVTRMTAAFALIADFGLITLGGNLKRKEYLSGRYADALAGLYIASATLKRVHDSGYAKDEAATADWVLTQTLWDIEQALLGVLNNLPNRVMAGLARMIAFPTGTGCALPTDRQGERVVDDMLDARKGLRETLTGDIYMPPADTDGLGKLEGTLVKVRAAAFARRQLSEAVRTRKIAKGKPAAMVKAAVAAGVLTQQDAKLLAEAEAAQDDAVQVNYFEPRVYKTLK